MAKRKTSVDQVNFEPVEILNMAAQISGGKSFTLALSKDGDGSTLSPLY
jgi:hypothetical protein